MPPVPGRRPGSREPPTDRAPSAFTDSRKNGSPTKGTSGQQHGGQQDDGAQPSQIAAPVGYPAADRVARRQRHQHGGDDVGPDDRRAAEVRRQQARGGNFGPRLAAPTTNTIARRSRGRGAAEGGAVDEIAGTRFPAARGRSPGPSSQANACIWAALQLSGSGTATRVPPLFAKLGLQYDHREQNVFDHPGGTRLVANTRASLANDSKAVRWLVVAAPVRRGCCG